ncbi:MAG: GNAT family N-acetyltransferase [Pseudomonadota bacterium]
MISGAEDPLRIVDARGVAPAALHQGMAEAFRDYVVPMRLSFDQFAFMLRHRGFDAALSRVALDGDRVAAFWLMASDAEAPGRAYLLSSGTAPAHRRRGLSARLCAVVIETLRAGGAREIVSEVIQTNHGARKLYAALGFRERRPLRCFDLSAIAPAPSAAHEIRAVTLAHVFALAPTFRDWAPTWQNDLRSLQRVEGDALCLAVFEGGRPVAYAALLTPTGTVADIAVRPDRRRHGLGSALLGAARKRMDGRARLLNADGDDAGFAAFMTAIGGAETVGQFELHLDLTAL